MLARFAVFVAFALYLPSAWAQVGNVPEPDCTQIVAEARAARLHDVAPVAGAEYQMTFVRMVQGPLETGELGNCRAFSFYRLKPKLSVQERRARRGSPLPEVPPLLAARYVVDATPHTLTRWTSNDVCPGLTDVLVKLEALLAPNLSGADRVPAIWASEQPYFGAWVNQPMNTPFRDDWYKLNVAAGDESALARWFGETRKALEACWVDTPPDLPVSLTPAPSPSP